MATANSLAGGGIKNAYDAVAASSDDSILVAAVTGRRIRVRSVLINHGDTTPSAVTFVSKGSGAGTSIYPPLKYPANGGNVMGDNEKGWFATKLGEALAVDTGSGSTTSIAVTYDIVPG